MSVCLSTAEACGSGDDVADTGTRASQTPQSSRARASQPVGGGIRRWRGAMGLAS